MRVCCVTQNDPHESSARRGVEPCGANIKRCLWTSVQNEDLHLFLHSLCSLLRSELCCRMSSAGLLAFIGGLIAVCQVVKLVWRCWCGFRQFVLSAFWQVDLRSYGKWAGKRDICTRQRLVVMIVAIYRSAFSSVVCSCDWCYIWHWKSLRHRGNAPNYCHYTSISDTHKS